MCAFSKLVRVLLAGLLAYGASGCRTTRPYKSSTSIVVIDGQRWSRLRIPTTFPIRYTPPDGNITIGFELYPKSADSPGVPVREILAGDLPGYQRSWDASIIATATTTLHTSFGDVGYMQLRSSDPNEELRALGCYRERSGGLVRLAFYSTHGGISPEVSLRYLNQLSRAKAIPRGEGASN